MRNYFAFVFSSLLAISGFAQGLIVPEYSYSPATGRKPTPVDERVVIRENWLPGAYCAIRRPPFSFEEVVHVAVSPVLLEVKLMQRCIKRLPKKYNEYTAPISMPSIEQLSPVARSGTVSCTSVKVVGAPERFSVSYANGITPKQEDVDQCFQEVEQMKADMMRTPPVAPHQPTGTKQI